MKVEEWGLRNEKEKEKGTIYDRSDTMLETKSSKLLTNDRNKKKNKKEKKEKKRRKDREGEKRKK